MTVDSVTMFSNTVVEVWSMENKKFKGYTKMTMAINQGYIVDSSNIIHKIH